MSYPRETKEFVPIIAAVNNVALLATSPDTVEVSLVGYLERPTTWAAADTLGTQIGVLIGPGTSHDYSQETVYPVDVRVWARVTDNPEVPVINCGSFRIS